MSSYIVELDHTPQHDQVPYTLRLWSEDHSELIATDYACKSREHALRRAAEIIQALSIREPVEVIRFDQNGFPIPESRRVGS